MSDITSREIVLRGQNHYSTTYIESIDMNSFVERTDCLLLTRGQIHDPKQEHKFHKFAKLPPELQLIIWTFALPEPRVLSLKYREMQNNDGGNDETQDNNIDTRPFNREGFYLVPCSRGREYILNYRLTCSETENIFQKNYSKLDVDVFTTWDSPKPIIDKPYLAWSATAVGAGATCKLKQYLDKRRDTLFVLWDTSLDDQMLLAKVLVGNTIRFPGVANIAVCFSPRQMMEDEYYRVLKDFASLRCLKSLNIVIRSGSVQDGYFSDMKFLEVDSNSCQTLAISKRQTFRGKNICEHEFKRFPAWGYMRAERADSLDWYHGALKNDRNIWGDVEIKYCIPADLVDVDKKFVSTSALKWYEDATFVSSYLAVESLDCDVVCSFDGSLPVYDPYYRLDSIFTEDKTPGWLIPIFEVICGLGYRLRQLLRPSKQTKFDCPQCWQRQDENQLWWDKFLLKGWFCLVLGNVLVYRILAGAWPPPDKFFTWTKIYVRAIYSIWSGALADLLAIPGPIRGV